MGIVRLVELVVGGAESLDYPLFELWVGFEDNGDALEFRIEVGFWRFWVSLPFRWLKS